MTRKTAADMLIYSESVTPRCRYTFHYVLEEILGTGSPEWTSDPGFFEDYREPKLCYAREKAGDSVFVWSWGLLHRSGISEIEIDLFSADGLPAFFRSLHTGSDFPFDLFSAIFFLVTRYEEYLPFQEDRYGRFSHRSSLAFRNNFLLIPIVNYWARSLKTILLRKYPKLFFSPRSFQAVLTYDIDIAYAYKGRPLWRTLASSIRDLFRGNLAGLRKRFQVLALGARDPYDIYEELFGLIESFPREQKILFFLSGPYGPHDKNIPPSRKIFRDLLMQTKEFAQTGIHPSYGSDSRPGPIGAEKNRLEQFSGSPVTLSRQHYLKLKFPDTYRALLCSGISGDYTLLYPDYPGFRAGTCTPFFFYDLLEEQQTTLRIFPGTFMDGTFRYRMKNTPEEAMRIIQDLIVEVFHMDGTFISLWHNDSLSEYGPWKGWRQVHDSMIRWLENPQEIPLLYQSPPVR